MGHDTINIDEAVNKITSLSNKENTISDIKSAIFDVLKDFSQEEKNKVVLQLSIIDPQSAVQQNNLGFIVPNIVQGRSGDSEDEIINEDIEGFGERKRWMNYVKKNNDGSWNKNESGQVVLEDWPNYQNLINDGIMFSPDKVKDKDFGEMKEIYKTECIDKLDDNSKNIIDKLSKEIIKQNNGEKIKSSTIVPIPTYYLEDKNTLNTLLDNLLKQDGDITVVFYFNGSLSRYDPSTNSYKNTSTKPGEVEKKTSDMKKEFDKKLNEKMNDGSLKGNKSIIALGYTYDKFPTIGGAKADMTDAIINAIDSETKDPIIVGLDADVYEIPEGYINSIKKQFDKSNNQNEDLSFVCAKRRWTKPEDKDQYLHFVEDLFVLGDDLIKNKQGTGLSITNGWTTSYRLNDIMKVKGIERDMEIAEDLALGYKLNWFHSKDGYSMNMNVKGFNGNKLYSDPRRGYSATKDGIPFANQWNPNFPFKEAEKREIANEEFNDIIKDILSNKKISNERIKKLENDINTKYCYIYKGYNNPSYVSLLKKFWNYNIGKMSQYRMIENGSHIKIIEK